MNTIGSVLLPLGSYVAMRPGASLNLLLAVNVLVNVVVLTLYALRSRRELRDRGADARAGRRGTCARWPPSAGGR